MKINYVLMGVPVLTGGTRTILEIANRLASRGHDVSVTYFGSKKSAKWIEKTDMHPIKFNLVKVPFIGNIFYRIFRKLFQKITSFKIFPYVELQALTKCMPDCDVNIATQSITTYAVYASKKGVPVSHFMHYEPLTVSNLFEKTFIEGAYLLPAKKIINGTWLRNQLKDNLNIEVPSDQTVYSGFYHNIFYPKKKNNKNGKIRIISLAKPYTPVKGFRYLIDAIKIVLKERNDVELVLYGTDKMPKLDIPFEFHSSPVDNELAELYNSADIFINPSLYESFPWPPLEAMACGVPGITTTYGVEDYAINGENCLIVESANGDAIAEAILRILNNHDLREKLIKNGLQTVKNYTWDNCVDSTERILNKFVVENKKT